MEARSRGQGALEYLLLLGGAVLIAAVVITLLFGIGSQGQGITNASAQSAFNTLEQGVPGYTPPPSNPSPDTFIDDPSSSPTITAGDSVTFNGSVTDNDCCASYSWDFEDPSTVPSSLEDPGSVQFNTVGSWNVTFNATDNGGLSDPTPATIQVQVQAAAFCGDASCNGTEDDLSCPQDCNTNVVAYYPFEEGSGQTTADLSGNGNNGTLGNSAGVDAQDPFWTPSGRSGNALEYDGTNDWVDLGTFSVGGSALTITTWFNADDFDEQYARIISKATGTANQDHWFMVSHIMDGGGYKPRFRLRTEPSGSVLELIPNDDTPNEYLSAGTWHHVAAVYDGSDMILYLDGQEVERASKTGSISTSGSVNVTIGNNPTNDRPFDGIIDDVRVYNRVLGAGEILTLYNNT